ncbi:hypothetical protein [Sorangium sp. So ce854]|uniref:hypothetical protein n=1 Tax=Sorangium sp. So ce854 TaxID=3133322 RepID=UPI003F639393
MRRSLIPMLLSSLALALAALAATGCSSTPPQPVETPTGASSAETPGNAGPEAVPNTREASDGEEDLCLDQQPTGDPPVCPPGCIWSAPTQKCIQERGVIVDQRPVEPVRDPRPAPTSVPKPAPTSVPKPVLTPQ